MRLPFFEICKRSFYHTESVVLSKHVTYYGPRSGFSHYNLTTPIKRAPLSAIQGRAGHIYWFEFWESLQVPSPCRFKITVLFYFVCLAEWGKTECVYNKRRISVVIFSVVLFQHWNLHHSLRFPGRSLWQTTFLLLILDYRSHKTCKFSILLLPMQFHK